MQQESTAQQKSTAFLTFPSLSPAVSVVSPPNLPHKKRSSVRAFPGAGEKFGGGVQGLAPDALLVAFVV